MESIQEIHRSFRLNRTAFINEDKKSERIIQRVRHNPSPSGEKLHLYVIDPNAIPGKLLILAIQSAVQINFHG